MRASSAMEMSSSINLVNLETLEEHNFQLPGILIRFSNTFDKNVLELMRQISEIHDLMMGLDHLYNPQTNSPSESSAFLTDPIKGVKKRSLKIKIQSL